uniref:Uncharacterized protein n=1 Tax=Neobodo designis TaxID=312471 RepID=A0A7S1M467_NEODS|mmetsp:Transcript_33735/g.104157  ORF Transcript_33735/g.104157 Transcript_33735/m.104157 type:complete len:420 (+) Transcript_33735:59-1318(+)|eukprot:CAMPEP_0174840476 /NCGR_PEP_ID=MMETSP1114-20130205/8704_1 /TAXON_ID=312471 /ORGANISM="Neobodo designis, Strain CCAP 1951/1" /LENGTH=419 /DNA_ID=CAMNT_0016074625 /DNA_START=57 /DNA_END=1316 /DNA_ORIENTATION=+
MSRAAPFDDCDVEPVPPDHDNDDSDTLKFHDAPESMASKGFDDRDGDDSSDPGDADDGDRAAEPMPAGPAQARPHHRDAGVVEGTVVDTARGRHSQRRFKASYVAAALTVALLGAFFAVVRPSALLAKPLCSVGLADNTTVHCRVLRLQKGQAIARSVHAVGKQLTVARDLANRVDLLQANLVVPHDVDIVQRTEYQAIAKEFNAVVPRSDAYFAAVRDGRALLHRRLAEIREKLRPTPGVHRLPDWAAGAVVSFEDAAQLKARAELAVAGVQDARQLLAHTKMFLRGVSERTRGLADDFLNLHKKLKPAAIRAIVNAQDEPYNMLARVLTNWDDRRERGAQHLKDVDFLGLGDALMNIAGDLDGHVASLDVAMANLAHEGGAAFERATDLSAASSALEVLQIAGTLFAHIDDAIAANL